MDQAGHGRPGDFLAASALIAVLLLDATHTSHTRAQTGIQRVCRSLFAELGKSQPVTGICRDPYQRAWRALDAAELRQLQPAGPVGGSRRPSWSLGQRLVGRSRRLLRVPATLPAARGLICPEIFSAELGASLPALFARVQGPRIAVFYDAIPLQFPELTPPATVGRFPAYLRELLQFDGVAAISETSAAALRDYWRWLGADQPPPVAAIPLAIDPKQSPPDNAPASTPPRILCVGTIEGRKNHLALLEAAAALWDEGAKFELQLIGLARPDTAGPALAKIGDLQRAGRPLLYDGAATDAAIDAAYGRCAFTVYPSLIEGFGLPVLESLQHGKPCVCSGQGALGELARAGGCVALESVDRGSLAGAVRRLLQEPATLAALATAARGRPLKTWTDYARELTAWMQTLPRRP